MSGDLTKDAIFAACDAHLFAHGSVPTYRDVREATGGTGSNSTLSRYIREWVATLPDRLRTTEARPDMPPHVWDLVLALWDEAVAGARDTAQAELSEERKQQQCAVDEALEARDGALAKADAETQRAHALEERLGAADRTLVEANRINTEQRDALTALRSELAAAQNQIRERDAEIARAREELAAVRSAAAGERAEWTRSLETETARWQREVDTARTAAVAAAKVAADRESALQTKLTDALDRVSALSREFAALQATHARLSAAAEQLQADLAARDAERDTAARDATRLQDAVDELRTERDGLARQLAERAARMEQREEQIAALLERLATKNSKEEAGDK